MPIALHRPRHAHQSLHWILPVNPGPGVLGGLTNGLTYTPAWTAINHYFFRKRPSAIGIGSSRSSLAGVMFPVALGRMLNKTNLGFGWTVHIFGSLMLTLSIIACVSVSSNAPKRKVETVQHNRWFGYMWSYDPFLLLLVRPVG